MTSTTSTRTPTDPGPAELFPAIAAEHDRCFWLDGNASRSWSGRRTVMGWLTEDDPSLSYCASRREVTRHVSGTSTIVGDDIFEVLESEIADDPDDVLWVGYFGYASRPDLPASTDTTGSAMPDAVWMRARHTHVVVHDDASDQDSAGRAAAPPKSPPPPAEYLAAFETVSQHLHAGNTYEANLTHRLQVAATIAPIAAYLRLRQVNPAPYAGFLQHRGQWLLSSSPERYATIGADRMIETRPIKGTTPRGATPALDAESRRRLAEDPKFRAENLMIVDLLRNDIGSVSKRGTVEVPELMHVESYPSVHQLVSAVRGELRDDVSSVAALRALFPPGSMTGAPKRRTMEVIEEAETSARGVYAGAFGWIDPSGPADLAVVIRSLTTTGDGTWTLGTGGGITVDSEPGEEYAEANWKAARLIAALQATDLPC
ncbi:MULTISPECIES: anthranilate synthase component I family protein [unclassified Nocardioides]|uniref:anthranilate synthase component I family protein n=1 Tax=unclassified Nocardioides TaxID=2615069 RepID=UPI0006F26805|nr:MULTISPECIES: anthranilate synthase component I family protein [unclassified Nocardioides]KRA37855.1 anthranilate synthase [Nocardioides sp. Root614]KRA91815.1 anthranilate synthase [Nocardioides sp. Root682]